MDAIGTSFSSFRESPAQKVRDTPNSCKGIAVGALRVEVGLWRCEMKTRGIWHSGWDNPLLVRWCSPCLSASLTGLGAPWGQVHAGIFHSCIPCYSRMPSTLKAIIHMGSKKGCVDVCLVPISLSRLDVLETWSSYRSELLKWIGKIGFSIAHLPHKVKPLGRLESMACLLFSPFGSWPSVLAPSPHCLLIPEGLKYSKAFIA